MANNIKELKIGSDSYALRPYGTCSSSASTVAKTVTCSGFKLFTGATIIVKFNAANSADEPTLNVNGTGDKSIYYRSNKLSSDITWVSGTLVEFYYDGTSWQVVSMSMPSASSTYQGFINTGAQTIKGEKTFSTGIKGDLTGNADTATKLETPRTLWGQSFDGSANIGSSTTAANMSYLGDVKPFGDGSKNMGTSSNKWKSVWTYGLALNDESTTTGGTLVFRGKSSTSSPLIIRPSSDYADFGNSTYPWNNIYVNNLHGKVDNTSTTTGKITVHSNLVPNVTTCDLGSSSYFWNGTYSKSIVIGSSNSIGKSITLSNSGSSINANVGNLIFDDGSTTGSGTFKPAGDGYSNIGEQTTRWNKLYAKDIYGDIHIYTKNDSNLTYGQAHLSCNGTDLVLSYGSNDDLSGITPQFRPNAHNKVLLGTSANQWKEIRGVNIYKNGSSVSTSDERYKNFIDDINIDFDKLKSIPKKVFTWKEGQFEDDGNKHIGTSAQKVKDIYPELVTIFNSDVCNDINSDEAILGVDYEKLSIVALAAIDKLNERITDLENTIKELKNKLM